MKLSLACLTLTVGLIGSAATFAQTTAPPGSTGLCKDGSYSIDATKKGACRGHKGVKDWFPPANAAASAKAATSDPAKFSTPAVVPAAAATAMPAKAAPAKTSASAPSTAPAAGGGPGQVWVNGSSKVYHCQGTKYYGKTKQGEYMTESAAKAAGNHADHSKACS